MKNQKGFSLIELLIVVLIIGIIAAIAIPNLLASRRSANEGSAISTLRTLHGAEVTYQSTSGAGSFGTLYAMGQAGLIDSTLSISVTPANAKNGYYLTDSVLVLSGNGLPSRYSIDCQPVTHTSASSFAATGSRRFFITEVGVIYANTNNAVITVTPTTRIVSGGQPLNN